MESDVLERAVLRARDGLATGRLTPADLTARKVGALLGKTTGALYHHFGSVEAFLFRVSQAGFIMLGAELGTALAKKGDLAAVAERFVGFGLEHPALYELMFERKYDWAELRRSGAMSADVPGVAMWNAIVAHLTAHGSRNADRDARLLYAGLHGLVSLATSGRANVGALETPDAALAKTLAGDLARRLCPGACRRTTR